MAAVTTSNPADFSSRTQTFFNPKLLKALQYNLKLAGYGLSEGYTTIGSTIRFFRPRKANTTGVGALVEGTAPATLTEVAIGKKDITLGQRGALATITDKVQAIDLLNTLKVYVDTMGADAALDYDTVIRNALITALNASNATYATGDDGGYFERFAGVVNTGNSATDFATLTAASKNNGKFTRGVGLGVATQLKTSKVPKIGGLFVGVIPPQVLHDVRLDTVWTQTGTFQDKNALFKDLAIILDGVAYVEAQNPFTEANVYGTSSSTDPGDGLTYSTLFLGADAFGIPNLTNKIAGGSQQAPKIVILNQPDKSDPLNQKTAVAWKSFFGADAFITDVSGERPRFVILRSKSTFI